MATYCYRCPECGEREESSNHDARLVCPSVPHHCGRGDYMVRDYRAESVSVGPNVLVSKRSLENL